MSLKLLKNITGSADQLVDSIGEAFDKNFTNQEERIEAKGKILNQVTDLIGKIQEYQAQIIQAEASGNRLQRNWRPLVMLAFAFIVVYSYFIQPAFFPEATHISEVLPDDFWELLKIGLGGYVIGRSAEKIAESVGANIQFIKKK